MPSVSSYRTLPTPGTAGLGIESFGVKAAGRMESEASKSQVTTRSNQEAESNVSNPSMKQNLCNAVLQLVLDNVLADGYGRDVQELVRRHFNTLPSRYALSVDPRRHDDVLLHMRLLNEVRDQVKEGTAGSTDEPGPVVSVRRVGLGAVESSGETESENRTDAARRDGSDASCPPRRLEKQGSSSGIPIKRSTRKRVDAAADLARSLPKPTFGSGVNLSSLITSPSKALRLSTKQSPRGMVVNPRGVMAASTASGSSSLPPRYASAPSSGLGGFPGLGGYRGSMESLDEHGREDDGVIEESPGSSSHGVDDTWSEGDAAVVPGWEVTVAAPDRPGLLTSFTSAISHSEHDLDIKEAHVFSSTDGFALQVFVVTSSNQHEETEDLQESLLKLLKAQWRDKSTSRKTEQSQEDNLRAAVESMRYEDWAVDSKDLKVTERLSGGSSGRLYKGQYRGQEVAIKVISLVYTDSESGDQVIGAAAANPEPPRGSSFTTSPPVLASAQELLKCFKREVSIMRIIRHKNVLQFIGACSIWPRLFIVTELMSKGSVRDVLDRQGTGLQVASALRVFRDAARGMDFLHRRGIVHRDLKAANLLIDENDVVKVCDFGVARLMPASHEVQQQGPNASNAQLLESPSADSSLDLTAETGTYRWMAPEVLEHKPYGYKADVFSFGITMWEILSGKVPHAGMTPLQAAVGVVQRGLRPVMPPNLPQPLVDLVQSCWDSNPLLRPSFSEILCQLDSMMYVHEGNSLFTPGREAQQEAKGHGGFTSLWKKTFGLRK